MCICTTYVWSIPFLILSFQNCQGTQGTTPTPSTFLMSVSSESLSPRSKSTVRKAASCGHVLFLCDAPSRGTPCSMMVEEPLPPKPASTTSFRCKDGRSARPYRGWWFPPQNLDKNRGNIGIRKCTYRSLEKHLQNDENSGRLVFQVQNCGMQEPIHPGKSTMKSSVTLNVAMLWIAVRSWHTTSCKPATSYKHGEECH